MGLACFFNQMFLCTPKEKILGKGHFSDLQRNINLYMFRDEFLVKKMIFDMRWVFNFFFPRERIRKRVTDTKLSTKTGSLPYRSSLSGVRSGGKGKYLALAQDVWTERREVRTS